MQATLAKLPTELVNAFSTFRNSPAPFSIQCGRKQNGTQNEKQEQNEPNKTRTETENSEKEEADESAWIIYWELWHCLCFNLLLFVYVAIEKYWTEILQYDLLRECENAVSRGGRGSGRGVDSCVCTASSCQISNGNEFVYGEHIVFWLSAVMTIAECSYDLPAEGICNGTLLFTTGKGMAMGMWKLHQEQL